MKQQRPHLIFPENYTNWSQKKIVDVAPLQRGFDLPTSQVINGEYPIVYSNGIGRFHNQYKVKAPGVVTGRSGTIGSLTYVEKDYWPHNTSLWVTDFKGNLPKFVYYLYQKIDLTRFSSGSGVPTLNRNDVHSHKVWIPNSKDEQQKIADFLTSVDTKIRQLTEKHHLLKEYKKGVMQQIFSQKIRFKDENGKAFPEWKWKPLSELATKKTSKNKDQTIKDVLTNSARDGVVPQREYFEKDIATEGNTENYYIVDVDDFVYNPRISELAPVGPINRNKVGKGIMSPLYSVFRFKKHTNVEFIEFFFKGSSWHRYMISVANIGARHDRMNISSSDLMSLPCPCPIAEEQQKITAFLQSIDNKIDAVAKQIDYTKQFKQGLLQQMFV